MTRSGWSTITLRGLLCLGIGLVALLMFDAFGAPEARADSTVIVNSSCTLPLAVSYADGNAQPACAPGTASGTTTISVPASANKYSVTSVLSITKNTNIVGAGAGSVDIDGGGTTQVFNIANTAQVTISGVTISGGMSGLTQTGCTTSATMTNCPQEDGLNGGGILNAGTLTLNSDVVTGNAAHAGVGPSCTGTGCLFVLGCFFFGGMFSCPASAGVSKGSGGWGGGIDNQGTLSVNGSTISSNSAGAGGDGTDGFSGSGSDCCTAEPGGSGGSGGLGGGLYNEISANATITNSQITGNAGGKGGNAGAGSDSQSSAQGGNAGSNGSGGNGGGIYNNGTLTITGSTLDHNAGGVGGNGASGGVGNGGLNNGTSRSANSGGWGGGLYTSSGGMSPVSLTNDTLFANTAATGGNGSTGSLGGSGGAIANEGLGQVTLEYVTIASDTAAGSGGGIFASTVSPTNEINSIIANNNATTVKNCGQNAPADGGNNLVFGDNSCHGTAVDPKLASALGSNGGPTPTLALQPGSGAIGLVPINACLLGTDQRGVSRPQGSACDAGAYEYAPPTIGSPTATVASPTAATISAQVDPNLKDTTVTVRYGTSPAYGSATAAADVGAGNSPDPFSASLSGLTPVTTYHYDIIATNGDGTTTTSDGTFTTPAPPPPPPPLVASVGAVSTSGTTGKLTISCTGGAAGATCSGPITLTSHETTEGKTIVAVAASQKATKAQKTKPKPKKVTKLVTVGSGSYSVPSGSSQKISLSLNATGRALLAKFYKLPVTVAVGGTTPISERITFAYPRIKSLVLYTAKWNGRGVDTISGVSVSGSPKGAAVGVVCKTGSCSPRSKHFRVKGSRLQLSNTVVTLQPKATVVFEVTLAGEVGHVLEIADIGSGAPKLSILCLPPGAKKPTKCA